MTNTALTVTEQLTKTTQRSSLDDLVNARTKRSLLLVDCSGSMDNRIASGERRIDKLRKVVTELRETHPVPVAAFGLGGYSNTVRLVGDNIPEPSGGTPMHKAIEFGRVQEANHLVLVTDGEPDSRSHTLDEARKFGGPIDVFFIGDVGSRGALFC